MRSATRVCAVLCLFASAAFAATPKLPPELRSPLDSVETLQGQVNVRSDGRLFVVTIEKPEGGGFRRFDVELGGQAGQALNFRADSAEIHYWGGHLVVVAPRERKALHFSLLDAGQQVRTVDAPLVSASDVAEVDSLLRSRYELTRISNAVAISSLAGPRALEAGRELKSHIAPMDTEDQDPGGGGGLGTCGATCTTRCGDGSSCSAVCTAPRCASCSCPASCSCK